MSTPADPLDKLVQKQHSDKNFDLLATFDSTMNSTGRVPTMVDILAAQSTIPILDGKGIHTPSRSTSHISSLLPAGASVAESNTSISNMTATPELLPLVARNNLLPSREPTHWIFTQFLDDLTGALDTQSGGIVHGVLNKAAAGRTTVTIAHGQVAGVMFQVIIGVRPVVGQGTHLELLHKGGEAYARLVQAQKAVTVRTCTHICRTHPP
ncbi:hypothetical protein ARMGADRAFT_1088646 [Armillaria gallica]|uniref:Uncharacterized protein n=1 Tax=Armillaria gallica TaxID=47427 RepID=A0A2H3CM82_ARMGA|nr:hypothetical protein ARMGADRAFT_1088646 [Armillaria gallica]